LAFGAQTLDEWRAWHAALRAALASALAGSSRPLRAGVPARRGVEEPDYRREKVVFYSEPGVAVPCYVLIPRTAARPIAGNRFAWPRQ